MGRERQEEEVQNIRERRSMKNRTNNILLKSYKNTTPTKKKRTTKNTEIKNIQIKNE